VRASLESRRRFDERNERGLGHILGLGWIQACSARGSEDLRQIRLHDLLDGGGIAGPQSSWQLLIVELSGRIGIVRGRLLRRGDWSV
jgi:hypothetical protein